MHHHKPFAILSLFQADQLHYIVLQVQTFTPLTIHTIYTEANHPYSVRIPLVRRKLFSSFFILSLLYDYLFLYIFNFFSFHFSTLFFSIFLMVDFSHFLSVWKNFCLPLIKRKTFIILGRYLFVYLTFLYSFCFSFIYSSFNDALIYRSYFISSFVIQTRSFLFSLFSTISLLYIFSFVDGSIFHFSFFSCRIPLIFLPFFVLPFLLNFLFIHWRYISASLLNTKRSQPGPRQPRPKPAPVCEQCFCVSVLFSSNPPFRAP